jgi:hypothetical protein
LLLDHGNQVADIASGTSTTDIIKKVNQFGFVKITDLASALNLSVTWDGTMRTVTVS